MRRRVDFKFPSAISVGDDGGGHLMRQYLDMHSITSIHLTLYLLDLNLFAKLLKQH